MSASEYVGKENEYCSMPHFYEIIVEDHLGSSWKEWFDGMEFEQKYIRDDQRAITVISGTIPDQAALYGILIKIRDLGLTLVSVTRVRQSPFSSGG